MTYLVMSVVMVVAAVLQAVVPSWTGFGLARFPFLAAVVMYYALTRERSVLLTAAFLAGLIQDSLSLTPLGYSSFCFVIIGALVNHYRDLLFAHHLITHVLFGSLVNFSVTLLTALLLIAGSQTSVGFGSLMLKCGGALVLGAVIMPLVFHVVETLEHRIGSYVPGMDL